MINGGEPNQLRGNGCKQSLQGDDPASCFFFRKETTNEYFLQKKMVCVCVNIYIYMYICIYIYLYVMYIFIFTKVYVLYVEREGQRESPDYPRFISTQELICSKHEHELLVQLQVKSR